MYLDEELEIDELKEKISELQTENQKFKELLQICRRLVGDASLKAEIDYETGEGR